MCVPRPSLKVGGHPDYFGTRSVLVCGISNHSSPNEMMKVLFRLLLKGGFLILFCLSILTFFEFRQVIKNISTVSIYAPQQLSTLPISTIGGSDIKRQEDGDSLTTTNTHPSYIRTPVVPVQFSFNSKPISRRSFYPSLELADIIGQSQPVHLTGTSRNVLFINSFDHTQTVSIDNLNKQNFNDLFQPKLNSPGIDYSKAKDEIQSQIIETQPHAIIFILSPLMLEDVPLFSKYVSNQLKYFYGLLRFMDSYQATKVFLMIPNESFVSVVHSSWSRAFSLALVSSVSGLQGNGGIISLNRIEAADGSNCTDIALFLKNILQMTSASFKTQVNFCSVKYPPLTRGKSVIFSTYFTTGKYSQYGHPFKPNKFSFMKKWFLTGKKLGIKLGIFHDELNQQFINQTQSFYPGTEFIKVTKLGPNRTPNDGRFFIWYDYLMANPDIERVLFTDLRDVFFFVNPFHVMEAIGDYLFLGSDNSFHMSVSSNSGVRRNTLKCHANDKEVSFYLKMLPFYNAGVLGGKRKTVMNFLKHITDLLSHTPKKMNCNMGTYAFVASKYFKNSSFTGYPFQSSFKIGVTGPTNVAVKHKTFPGNNVHDETFG